MDDEFSPQIINVKHTLNSPNDHPCTPRRPMDEHPYTGDLRVTTDGHPCRPWCFQSQCNKVVKRTIMWLVKHARMRLGFFLYEGPEKHPALTITLRTIIIVLPPLPFRTYQILPHTNSYFDCLYSSLDLLQ